MKKRLTLLLIFIMFLSGCISKEKIILNELQVAACETASEYDTCQKLNDLGLVSNNECCAMLGKCCNSKIIGYAISDLEITMCDAAQEGGTCDKLAELGMVTKEECCYELGECCTPTLTCSQAGGSCKYNTCGSYSNCDPVSGSCTAGYCCSGACTTPAQTCGQDGGSCKDNTCGFYSNCTTISGSCTTGYCCTGTCTISTLTCSQAGGSCKDNTCNSYSDCTPVSGSCTSGYCCSGNCTTTITTEVCSSDIECAQCGNACIQKTQWNSNCASTTISFDCKCVSNSCTLILKEAENKTEEIQKTMLADCSKTCTNKNGCVCILDCEKKETEQGFDCGKKTTTKTEISKCGDNCEWLTPPPPCLEVGTQKQEADGTMIYCSSGKKLETAKEAGENCNNDYECLTYTCNEGICFEEQEEGTGIKSSQIMLILGVVIFLGGLAFLALKFLNTKKAVVKGEKKIEKKGFEIQEPKQKYSYRYRPEFDVLEKKLKESLKSKK